MRVLVTGGTGYLGRAVVHALAARKHDVVVFARAASRSALPGRLVDGDIRDAAAVARAVDGCEVVCHLAALVSIWRRRRQDFDDVNVGGLRNVLDAASTRAVRVVYTSSFLARPPAGHDAPLAANDYQRTKVAAERLAADAAARGTAIVTLYPGVVYGPGAATEGNLVGRLVADHLARRLPGVIGPECCWSFAYVEDVAAAHAAAAERARIGARLELGGENATQWAMFEHVRATTGRRLPRRIPFPVATAIATVEEWRAAVTGGLPLVTRGAVEIFRHDWPLDSYAAAQSLGYRVTPLADGIRRTVDALRRRDAGALR